MKRNYVMMAMAAAMLASCAQTGLVEEIAEEPQKAIGFSTFADKTTRAISDTELEKYHQTFGVWAYKTYKGTESTVMNHYQVMYDDSGSNTGYNWDYDGTNAPTGQVLKYWDRYASYEFFAYAPYNSSNVTIESDVIKISEGEYAANENLQKNLSTTQNTTIFSGVGNKSTTASTDWMIAEPISRAAGQNDKVDETFSHTMSKLIVMVKTSNDFPKTITINSISVGNVHGVGDYNISATGWTATSTVKDITGAVGNIEKGNTYYSMEYLVIPSADDPKFNINYTIDGESFDVVDATITGITEFVASTVYTLTVTVGPNPIHFDATVSAWTPDPTTPDNYVTIN